MYTISNEIKQFITEEPTFPNSRWFVLNKNIGSVYLRRGTRRVDGSKRNFITIANIQIKERYRGKRLFSSFVQELQELIKNTNYVGLYAECVHNNVLQSYFTRHGWNTDHNYLNDVDVVEHNYWLII
jgi:hypothetical protein